MSTQSAQPPDDVVDRAALALRDEPTPAGPSPLLAERTRQALARAVAAHRPAAHRARRWAAAVLVGGAGAAVWLAATRQAPTRLADSVSGPDPSTRTVAAADVETIPARITGFVRADGVPPELLTRPPPLLVPRAAAGPNCGHPHAPPRELSLLVGPGGGIANVVVSVTAGLQPDTEFPHAPTPAVLDQKDCTYFPRVVAMQVGQDLVAKNSDPFLHSVHTNPSANVPVNIAQYTVDPVGARLKPIREPETFKVTCDLHPWMVAWVAAFDHPFYAVTRTDGSFDMPAVPPGTYTLMAWHERLGSVKQQVIVTYEGRLPEVRFRYGPDRVAAALADRDAAVAAATGAGVAPATGATVTGATVTGATVAGGTCCRSPTPDATVAAAR